MTYVELVSRTEQSFQYLNIAKKLNYAGLIANTDIPGTVIQHLLYAAGIYDWENRQLSCTCI